MSTIVTRAGKGSALTHTEVDANFTNLNTDKLQSGNTAASLTITSATINGGAINGTTVGATTPAAGTFTSLSDSGNLAFTGTGNRITGDFSNATLANRVMFQTSTVNSLTSIAVIPNGTAGQTQISLESDSAVTNGSTFQMVLTSDARLTSGARGTGTFLPMTFYTGGSERMRIDTSGNVGIGTASPSFKLDVTGTLRSTGEARFDNAINLKTATLNQIYFDDAVAFTRNGTGERARIDSSGNLLVGSTTQVGSGKVGVNFGSSGDGIALISSGTSDRSPLVFFNGNGFVGRVSTSGSNTAYLTSSDHRLKDNVQPMTGALSKVAALKPCTYRWKADGSDGEGFIAHELAEVVPQCVAGDKDAVDSEGNPIYQGIDTSFLVATLTAALQEAHGLIKDLQSRVQALENA